jgi:hypothetical protein
MKHVSNFILMLALAGAVLTSAPPSSHAQPRLAPPSSIQGPTEQRGWGVAGAIGCGFGIRASIATGGSPPIVCITGILCLMALADVITS